MYVSLCTHIPRVFTCLRNNRLCLGIASFLQANVTRRNWAERDDVTVRPFWAGTGDPPRPRLAAARHGRQELLCTGRQGPIFRIRRLQPGALLRPWPLPSRRRKISKYENNPGSEIYTCKHEAEIGATINLPLVKVLEVYSKSRRAPRSEAMAPRDAGPTDEGSAFS